MSDKSYDPVFVQEIQKRHGWPVFCGVGPFKNQLEGRVAIRYIGLSVFSYIMLVPKPEYESLPPDIQAKLGEPMRALDEER